MFSWDSDYITGETNHESTRRELLDAFQPLAGWRYAKERVFACMGNHDYENPSMIKSVFQELGVRLLIDEEAILSIGWR